MVSERRILVVEDDEDTRMLTRHCIRQTGLECEVIDAVDGEAALDILRSRDRDFDLVLLDLNLPRVNGFEVLSYLQSHPELRHLNVVVFSSSDEQRDVKRAHDLGANSYVRKEVDFDLFRSRLKLIVYYWLGINERRIQPSVSGMARAIA